MSDKQAIRDYASMLRAIERSPDGWGDKMDAKLALMDSDPYIYAQAARMVYREQADRQAVRDLGRELARPARRFVDWLSARL